MITMRPIEEDGIRKVWLGDGLEFPVDALPIDLRVKWDIACARIEKGEDMSGALKAITREALAALWPQILMRTAHRNPQTNGAPGLAEKSAVRLKAPPGHVRTEVWLNSGRRVRPDERGEITVSDEEAKPLLANGWTFAEKA
jgi:hypothetical protein